MSSWISWDMKHHFLYHNSLNPLFFFLSVAHILFAFILQGVRLLLKKKERWVLLCPLGYVYYAISSSRVGCWAWTQWRLIRLFCDLELSFKLFSNGSLSCSCYLGLLSTVLACCLQRAWTLRSFSCFIWLQYYSYHPYIYIYIYMLLVCFVAYIFLISLPCDIPKRFKCFHFFLSCEVWFLVRYWDLSAAALHLSLPQL